MIVLPPDILSYCESRYYDGGYDTPKSWPGDTPPQYVIEEEECDKSMVFSYGNFSATGAGPLQQWYGMRERVKLNLKGFEYIWLKKNHPELLKHCAKPSLPMNRLALIFSSLGFVAVTIVGGIMWGWLLHWLGLWLGFSLSPWLVGLTIGTACAIFVLLTEVRRLVEKQKYLKKQYDAQINWTLEKNAIRNYWLK